MNLTESDFKSEIDTFMCVWQRSADVTTSRPQSDVLSRFMVCLCDCLLSLCCFPLNGVRPSLPRMTLCSHSPSPIQWLSALFFVCVVHFLEVSVLQTLGQKLSENLLLDQKEKHFILWSCFAPVHESILTFNL